MVAPEGLALTERDLRGLATRALVVLSVAISCDVRDGNGSLRELILAHPINLGD